MVVHDPDRAELRAAATEIGLSDLDERQRSAVFDGTARVVHQL